MKSIYIPWEVALKERERPLEDLRTWTSVDTITLSCEYGSKILLPSSKGFRRSVSTASKTEFESVTAFMQLVKDRGFKISGGVGPLFVPFNIGTKACVDFTGRRLRGPFESWGCPNNPEVIAYGEALVRGIVTMWPELDYLTLDHLEYPCNFFSPNPKVDLRDLFVCFCSFCEDRADREGLDMVGMRREVASFYDMISSPQARRLNPPEISPSDILKFLAEKPYLAMWLNFRMKSMTEYVATLVHAARDASAKSRPSLKIGFWFHLPSYCSMIGTDYDSLCGLFDFASPKFPDYMPGLVLPILAREIATKTKGWSEEAVMVAMRQLLDLGPGPKHYDPLGEVKDALLYSNASHPSMVARQERYIRHLRGQTKLVPHIWESSCDIRGLRLKRRILRELGYDDYSVWAFEDGLSSENIRRLKGIL
jgi:hypothetical protein